MSELVNSPGRFFQEITSRNNYTVNRIKHVNIAVFLLALTTLFTG